MTRLVACLTVLTAAGLVEGDSGTPLPHFRAEVVASGLVTPWSLAFTPDGRLFIAERNGRIRVVEGGLREAPWATVAAYDAPERSYETGLMGLAIDPGFPARRFVYACYTHRATTADSAMHNRIVRLAERDGRGGDETVLLDRIPAAAYHNGCRLKFGPDGKLYATTGDAQGDAQAQDPRSLAGKILRLNSDGTIPADNPFPGSPVWSLGHRNAQGLAWEPGTNRLFVPEHGTGGIDELNVIERGGNYGWPVARGRAADPRYTDPVLVFVAAPTGAVFPTGSRYPDLPPGVLVVASLSGQRLLLIRPTASGVEIVADSALTGYGRLRDVIQGPDGYLYVATSNRDGRGTPRAEDDRVLRLLPAAPR
jgi:glucose/arabinose dehydrogenase